MNFSQRAIITSLGILVFVLFVAGCSKPAEVEKAVAVTPAVDAKALAAALPTPVVKPPNDAKLEGRELDAASDANFQHGAFSPVTSPASSGFAVAQDFKGTLITPPLYLFLANNLSDAYYFATAGSGAAPSLTCNPGYTAKGALWVAAQIDGLTHQAVTTAGWVGLCANDGEVYLGSHCDPGFSSRGFVVSFGPKVSAEICTSQGACAPQETSEVNGAINYVNLCVSDKQCGANCNSFTR